MVWKDAQRLKKCAKDLEWRISDFMSTLKSDVEPLLDKEPPVQFRKLTMKEKIPAYSFLSDESLQHLKIYVPTLKTENKWLWQGKRRHSHLDAESVNDLLKKLADDAQLQLSGAPHYHAFRKLFMRTGVELGCNHWAIRMLVGKAIKGSDLTYISQAQLRETYRKISNVLRINEPQPNAKIPSLEEAVDLVMQVQKAELVEKVKKLWNQKYSEFTTTGSGETIGVVIAQPDFDSMTPKELLKEYLKLKAR